MTTESEIEFRGSFVPPSIGQTSAPIPIAGQGSLVVTETSLRASGFKAGGFAVLPVLLSAVGAAIGVLAVKFLVFPSMSPSVIGGVIAAGLVAGASAGRKPKDEPYELDIPWENIKKVNIDKTNAAAAAIVVKKFKPKGTIHFAPEGGAEDVGGVVHAVTARMGG